MSYIFGSIPQNQISLHWLTYTITGKIKPVIRLANSDSHICRAFGEEDTAEVNSYNLKC